MPSPAPKNPIESLNPGRRVDVEDIDMESSQGFVRRVFRKKKVLPPRPVVEAHSQPPMMMKQRPGLTSTSTYTTTTLRPPLIRKKIIKPFIPQQIPTELPPVLIPTEQNALNRSQDDPRCEFFFVRLQDVNKICFSLTIAKPLIFSSVAVYHRQF